MAIQTDGRTLPSALLYSLDRGSQRRTSPLEICYSQNRKWIYFFRRNALWELFFPGEGLLRFIFSRRRPFKNYFFKGGLVKFIFSRGLFGIFFPLYKPIKKVPNIFFSHLCNWVWQSLVALNLISIILYHPFCVVFWEWIPNSGFIFSWGGPFEIYFFLEKAFALKIIGAKNNGVIIHQLSLIHQ